MSSGTCVYCWVGQCKTHPDQDHGRGVQELGPSDKAAVLNSLFNDTIASRLDRLKEKAAKKNKLDETERRMLEAEKKAGKRQTFESAMGLKPISDSDSSDSEAASSSKKRKKEKKAKKEKKSKRKKKSSSKAEKSKPKDEKEFHTGPIQDSDDEGGLSDISMDKYSHHRRDDRSRSRREERRDRYDRDDRRHRSDKRDRVERTESRRSKDTRPDSDRYQPSPTSRAARSRSRSPPRRSRNERESSRSKAHRAERY